MLKIGDTFYLTAPVVINTDEYKPQTFGGGGSGDGSIGNSRLGALISAATRAHILNTFPAKIAKDVKDQESNIVTKLQTLPQTLDDSIAALTQQNPAHNTADTAKQLENYVTANNLLLTQKTQEYSQQKTIADSYYYGRDFFSYPTNRFISLAISNGMVNMSPDVHYKKWFTSLQAAYNAKYIQYQIDYLTKTKAWLQGLTPEMLSAEALRLQEAERRAANKQVPSIPAGVSLDENMRISKATRDSAKLVIGGENAFVYGVFYTKVRNGGEWDYKQRGRQFEEFGNFNYGATGTAAGIPEQILLRAAGAAQSQAGTSEADFGKWWKETPYGDDRVDQVWIKAGIEHAKTKGY